MRHVRNCSHSGQAKTVRCSALACFKVSAQRFTRHQQACTCRTAFRRESVISGVCPYWAMVPSASSAPVFAEMALKASTVATLSRMGISGADANPSKGYPSFFWPVET